MPDHPVPLWPLYRLTADENDKVSVSGPAAPAGPFSSRAEAVEAVAELAALLTPARPVRAEAIDHNGTTYPLLIAPDGTATEADTPRAPSRRRRPKRAAPTTPPTARDELPAAAPRSEPPAPVLPPARQLEPPSTVQTTRIPSVLRIQSLVTAGRLTEALAMAKAFDDATARTHGPSDSIALQAREVHAHVRAEAGELSAAVQLYRDVAERWAIQGATEQADTAADRAHALWLRITDPQAALTTGETVVRMRSQIPGADGRAYQQAVRHLARTREQRQH